MDSSRRDESIDVSLDDIASLVRTLGICIGFDFRKFLADQQNFPRRAYSAIGPQHFKTPLFKPSSVYVKFGTSSISGNRSNGVMNPAYRDDTPESPEPVTDIDDVKIPLDETTPNQTALGYDLSLNEINDNQNDNISGQENDKMDTLAVDNSKNNGSGPEQNITRNDDVIINMQRDLSSQLLSVGRPAVSQTSSFPMNGIRRLKGRPSLMASMRKQEKPPPMDENYLRKTLKFSEDRIKGRRMLYLKRGPLSNEDQKWLSWIEDQLNQITGDKKQVDQQKFKQVFGTKKDFFATRFFEIFDQDGNGSVEVGELIDGLTMLMKGTPAQKLNFLFDVYDADGSGSIDRNEFKNVLRACMEESSLRLTDENIEDLTDVLFDAADANKSGAIVFEDLRNELEKHPGVIENLSISAAQWLKGPAKAAKGKPRFRYLTKDYVTNNVRKVVFFFTYWIVNIILFCVAVYQYRDSNRWVHVARGCGLCLNFNCMWVLVLMLRKCITWLRMTQLCHVLPFDQHILFHKMTGIAILAFSLVHTFAHIGNAAVVSNESKEEFDPLTNTTGPGLEIAEILFTTKAGIGWLDHSAYITGWILLIILIVMIICSRPFVRRSGYFEVFYWTHMLYVPFWILVLFHGPNFWKWFVLPGLLFLLEKICRSKLIKMARYGDTFIEEVNLLPSGVTHLIISRPLNFKYQPGDYLFIQIPEIAKQEWHPFTISSAPEMEDYLWLHIRSAGHWTTSLYKYFENLRVDDKSPKSRSKRGTKKFAGFERAYSRKTVTNKTTSTKTTEKQKNDKNKIVKVKCYIDGPYGTGTREVFGVDHAVLVGSGIGVTPMASILQSVWYKFIETRLTCPKCTHVWYDEEETTDMTLKKVDFVWINRDQKSFEWFLTLLNQLEVEQISHGGPLENCIQTHLYMTAAQKKTDMKGIGLQIALDLMYERQQKDLITGLRTKTNPGRPDWNKIFQAIKAEKKGKVKVFFCGVPALGQTVKESATRYGFDFCKENF